MSENIGDQFVVNEFFFSSAEPGTEEKDGDDKIIWKDILCEGTFAMTPERGGFRRKAFKIVADGETDWSRRVVSMSDVENSVKDKAFQHITIPVKQNPDEKGHDDLPLQNTGYVRKTRRIKKKVGNKLLTILQGGLGFTEPDVAGKVRRGTIPNVSCGIFEYTRKHDGRHFPAALKHVSLTGSPVLPLDPFKAVYASDEEIEDEPDAIHGYEFADGEEENGGTQSSNGTSAEIIWDDKESFSWIRENLEESLMPERPEPEPGVPFMPRPSYYVSNIKRDPDLALVDEHFKGDRTRYVIPFNIKDSGVEPAPATRWVQVREAMIAASDDLTEGLDENRADQFKGKLQLALDKSIQDDHSCTISDFTMDGRAIIASETGSEWVANYFKLSDGEFAISPPYDWQRIKEPDKSKQKEQPQIKNKSNIKLSEEPPSRLDLARQRRRELVG